MKKLKFLSFLTMLTMAAVWLCTFTACSSDDDDDVSSDDIANNIVGTWQSTHIEGYWYGGTMGDDIIKVDQDIEENLQMRFLFKANGTCQYYYYLAGWNDWIKDGSENTYRIMGNKVVIFEYNGDVSGTYKVLSLSHDKVVIEGTLEEGDQYTFRLTLKKVD